MPREKDPFRDHVEFLRNNKKWKCKFCNNEYSGSVTRIKAHLAGVGRLGIQGCKDVTELVKSRAIKAMEGKGAAESSNGSEGNVEEGPHLPVTANYENTWRETSFAAIPYLSSDVTNTVGASSSAFLPMLEMNMPSQSLPAQNTIPGRDILLWPQQPQPHAGDSSVQLPNSSYPSGHSDLAPEDCTNMPRPLNAEEGEHQTELPQDVRMYDALVDGQPGTCRLVDESTSTLKRKLEELSNREADMDELEAWCRKAERIKGEYWSMVQAFREGRTLAPQQVERVDDFSKEVEDILGHCNFRKGLTTHATGCRKSLPLVTTELVGKESGEIIKKICDFLTKDEIFIIGICGMGGVGKTAILMHVHNRLLDNPSFDEVFWVTVPQEFSDYELQDEIANAVGLDYLSKFKDVKRRACILNKHLKKKRGVLILDGLLMHFDIEDVGIPVEKGGLKLVLTTRSLDVCHKMLCHEQIKIKSLHCKDDCWSLFFKKLCSERELSSEVKKIVSSILNKCGGLPLAIIEIATHMRGVKEVQEWKDVLQKLEDSKMELDVFKKLKLSYIKLANPQVQRCFLHLVLCVRSYDTKKDVIESFIDEGLLGGIVTRQGMHRQGNTILDKINKACLGVDIKGQDLHVHPLTEDMALQTVMSTTRAVKVRQGLEEIQEEELWTDHLEKVFLQSNDIEEIPDGMSPNCPKLTRLSWSAGYSLKAIPESFFRHLMALKVLDLSETELTKLPDAISDLESLEALLVRGCWELRHIPCVRNLKSLRKLDLNGCSMIEEVPEGMEMLVNLRYLNLYSTNIETLPEEILGKLVNLQYLAINMLKAGEEIKLTKLESLFCSFPNVEIFNACTRFLEQNSTQEYYVTSYHIDHDVNFDYSHGYNRRIIIKSCHHIAARGDVEIGGDGPALLPKNVQVLAVRRCDGMTSLCQVGPLDYLEKLMIREWEELEQMGVFHFPKLEELEIIECSKLKHLFEEGQGPLLLEEFTLNDSEELEVINIAASNLKSIEVRECPEMKRVGEWGWLITRFPKLESVRISNCEKLEEIIAGPLPSGATCFLNHLVITGCNNLKGVLLTHHMLLHLPHLREIQVEDCKDIEAIAGIVPDMMHSSFPNLIHLTLENLPELRSICDGTMSCDSIQYIKIWNCPKLKRIPLQLRPLDNGLPSSPPPPSLRVILMERQVWESLEWDPPLARSSLEPFVKFCW